MEQEKNLQAEKRRQEREYLQKMLVENEKHKAKMREVEDAERLEDIKAQEAYARMLERQEADRAAEIKKREDRAQTFQNRLAGTVLKKLEDRANQEEQMIAQYQQELERRTSMLHEQKLARFRDDQVKMREYL